MLSTLMEECIAPSDKQNISMKGHATFLLLCVKCCTFRLLMATQAPVMAPDSLDVTGYSAAAVLFQVPIFCAEWE